MSLYESDGWIVGREEETLPSGTKLTRIKVSHDWREAVSESIKRGRADLALVGTL